MTTLSRSERLKVLELVAEVAGEAAQNTNVVWMIEFQEELVEKLYRKMVALLEEPGAAAAPDAGATTEPDEDKGGAEPQAPLAPARPRKVAGKARKAAKKTPR
jgi:nucleoid-associated protein YgaU